MSAGRLLLLLLSAVLFGAALFEVTMQPSSAERLELLGIFLAMAVVAGIAAWLVPRWANRARSVQLTVVVLSMASVLIVTAAVALAADRMFLSSHDLQLLVVVLGFGLFTGLAFATAISRPMTADMRRMANTADHVAGGDFTARTGVERRDEVGALARAIDEMAERLDEAERERSRDEESRRAFLAAVGHDLRTPLAALQAALESVADGVAPEPERYLQSMQRDVAVLTALVDDLFLLAKIEAGSLEIERVPVDLTEIADEAIEVLRPVAHREGVELRLEADGRTVTQGGPEALSRVMRNLLENAIRHAPADSEVLVSVSNGDGALVEVHDEGAGFDPDFVDEAFESFVRADPSRNRASGGAGLGLAIAQGFVHALGGEIWAEPGPGGKVAFRLPAADQRSTRTPRQKAM